MREQIEMAAPSFGAGDVHASFFQFRVIFIFGILRNGKNIVFCVLALPHGEPS
jgi:hypothetical protein